VRKALFAVLHGQRTLDVWPIARPARRGAQPDLVVEGTVVRMSGRISVRILSGKTGDALDGVQLQPRDARFKALDARSAAELMEAVVKAAHAPPAAPPAAPPPRAAVAALPPPEPEPPAPPAPQATPASKEPRLEKPRAGEAERSDEAAMRVEPEPRATQPTWVDIAVGGGFVRRTLGYNEDLFHALDAYRLTAGASLQVEAEAYPLERAHLGALSHLGIAGRYNREPGLASVDDANDTLPTLSDAWEVGLKYRWPFTLAEGSAAAQLAHQRFSFQIPPGATHTPVIPGVSYSAARLALGARVPFAERFALLAVVAYLPVFGSGQMGSATYFPRLSVAAVEGGLGAAVRVFGPIDGRVFAAYRRYYYSMNPKPGDPFIAGGALDEYLTVTASAAARW
jgi:hypothetical protein